MALCHLYFGRLRDLVSGVGIQLKELKQSKHERAIRYKQVITSCFFQGPESLCDIIRSESRFALNDSNIHISHLAYF